MEKPAHLVCFQIGQETYGVDIFSVREIVKPLEITPVPGTPAYVLGIINLRGRIISVMDLAERLRLAPAKMQRSSRILVVSIDGSTLGFLVDAATEVMKLPESSVEPPPEELKRSVRADFIHGVGKLDSRLVIVLNLPSLLAADEVVVATEAAVSRERSSASEPQ